MDFTNEFEVKAPVGEVFTALLDIERVAPCVPGAQVLEKTGDNIYKVAIKVKLGPVVMQYKGDVEVLESDEKTHTAAMHVNAKEARGQGSADATSMIALEERDGVTHSTIHTDVKLSGKAAAMGGRMVGDVSAKMVDTFATNLAAMLEGGGEEPATERTAAAANGASAQTESRSPLREAPPPAAETELNAVDLAGSVIAGRLQDPKTLAAVVGGAFLLGYLVGKARG